MRDLLDKLDALAEGSNLAASEVTKYEWRFRRIIEKIKTGDAFEDQAGNPVIIDPREARRLTTLYNSRQLVGQVQLRTVDEDGSAGPVILMGSLKKTADLQKPGGVATTASGEKRVSKEDALLKPTQIGIVDQDISAAELASVIQGNTVLASTDYGQAVVGLSQQIAAGKPAVLPSEYQNKDNEQIRKAMVDYAGEYLGVQAMIQGQSKFPRKQQFLRWLGSDLDALVIRFPRESNNNLADSFASITNPDTSHTLNISSKGTGGGAPPAISGLKIPDHLRQNPKFASALEFIDICQKSDRSGGPTTITSAFDAVNLIYRLAPSSLPREIQRAMPFPPRLMPWVVEQIRSKGEDQTPLPQKYNAIVDPIKTKSDKATPGGKLVYALKNAVQTAINDNNAIPEFREVILEILEMNFIQQYADYEAGRISFVTQWPAKIEGVISVEHKSSAVSPTDGGFSFKLGRPDNFGADEDLGAPGDQDNPGTDTDQLDRVGKVRADITARSKGSEKFQPNDKQLGRKRR